MTRVGIVDTVVKVCLGFHFRQLSPSLSLSFAQSFFPLSASYCLLSSSSVGLNLLATHLHLQLVMCFAHVLSAGMCH